MLELFSSVRSGPVQLIPFGIILCTLYTCLWGRFRERTTSEGEFGNEINLTDRSVVDGVVDGVVVDVSVVVFYLSLPPPPSVANVRSLLAARAGGA